MINILGPIRAKVRPPSRPRRHSHPRLPALRHVRRRGAHRQAGGRAHRARLGLHHLQVHQDQGLASRRVLLLLPARRARRHCRLSDHRQDVPRVGGAHRRHQLVRLHPTAYAEHQAATSAGTITAPCGNLVRPPRGNGNARFHPIHDPTCRNASNLNNHRKRSSIRVSARGARPMKKNHTWKRRTARTN